jgi:hypothetical protein
MKALLSDRHELRFVDTLIGDHLGAAPGEEGAKYALDLSGCVRLRTLPSGLSVPVLVLDHCVSLEALPEDLDVIDLSMRGCVAFSRWPTRMRPDMARLDLRGCTSLRSLPDALRAVVHLDLSGCTELAELPPDLVVYGSIDLADTQIRHLPVGVRGAAVRWRGIPIPVRVALDPGWITMADVVTERNAERRRVLIERMGYERFVAESKARVLDCDRDPGGPRELIRVELEGDEPLVFLCVRCPSTGQRYVLRVPPSTPTCHAAAAWIAGFDDPADYAPLVEA